MPRVVFSEKHWKTIVFTAASTSSPPLAMGEREENVCVFSVALTANSATLYQRLPESSLAYIPISHPLYRLKQVDIEFMKQLHEKVNVIPVIAKADTLTPEECARFKKTVLPL